ncbi:hypothetical protein INT43_003922 [Umbelopsis isabellina]|uniref:Lon protease homolog n=1 Tax=Mortierella isabellina TaxID=91625 RepID=A0A8H7PT89_MORIS|nr:hypothetical protein INT43_003922 [Umbelopsis isabellina]
MSSTYPDSIPLVILENKVLLPSVVTKVTIRGREASTLTRKLQAWQDKRQEAYVGCTPLKTLTTNSSDSQAVDESPSEPSTAPQMPMPSSSSNSTSNGRNLANDLYSFGCLGRVIRVERVGFGGYAIFLEGLARFRVEQILQERPHVLAKVQHFVEEVDMATNVEDGDLANQIAAFRVLSKAFVNKMRDLQLPDPLIAQLSKLMDNSKPGVLANILVSVIETTYEEKLDYLSTTTLKARLIMTNEWMTRQLHVSEKRVLKISQQIHSNIEGKLSKKQREFYLRQQLNAIKNELGEKDAPETGDNAAGSEDEEMSELKRRLLAAMLPKDVEATAMRELKRLKKLHSASAEWSVARTYLDVVADLPWSKSTQDVLDISKARSQLEGDHFGLDTVKRRVLEYLSVIKVKGDLKAPILCFVGPPGVGKTSLGKSIATAMRREFHRISLGGVRDEADIRGHRRTYVGAMPGLIIHGMRKTGVNNPVILLGMFKCSYMIILSDILISYIFMVFLDEIDKTAQSSHYGDPSAALLEVLDPEQNNTFSDHYLNLPFDLSKVLFIATANSVDTIPAPLLDRMELIKIPGYTFEEKLHISRQHILPKQIKAHGLNLNQIDISDTVLLSLAENYTRESGVRNFERKIASVVRAKCVEWAELREAEDTKSYNGIIEECDLERILGLPPYEKEIAQREAVAGVITGLAYSGSGNGEILLIEASHMPGEGKLQLTGSLGDVIRESAQIALTWVKSHAYDLKLTESSKTNLVENRDVHIHFPAGAVAKDGPSAGVALATAIVSLFSERRVPPTTAMTGEISLSGRVLPVGGIKEKVLSAHRAGIKKIIIPARNRRDVTSDIPANIQNDIEFVFAKTICDVLDAALILDQRGIEIHAPWIANRFESHL